LPAPDKVARITLDGVASPYPLALMLPQNDTERLLEKQLNAFGVKLERGVELTIFAPSSDGVVSTLCYADGSEENLTSSWLVGCDGAHSIVRHQLGMEFSGHTLPSNWILADLHLENVPNPGEITVSWHSDGVLAIFPITKTRYRVIADVSGDPATTQPSDPTLEQVQAVIVGRGFRGVKASEPIWLAGFNINERKVSNYSAGRVFLAGDASHIHSPAGGQGMNTGMQDACNLAWKLAMVVRGICPSEPLLGSYSIERSAIGDEVLTNAGRMTEVAMLRGDFKQSIRNHLMSLVFGMAPVRQKAADVLTELSIGYPKSPLTENGSHGGGPDAGQRAPIRNGEPPIGAGRTPLFALSGDRGKEAMQLIAKYAGLLEPNVRRPYGEDGLWLVRPDGYVALATRHDRFSEVAEYLDRIGG
jgi:2-polyprenyl-6-methoxyphenol hydroxylase-like FAD-dependent oxidoreductase